MLFEGLDALASSNAKDTMMTMLLGGAIIKDEKEREEFLSKQSRELEKDKTDTLPDRIILLKAKLIGLRDKELVNELSMEDIDE